MEQATSGRVAESHILYFNSFSSGVKPPESGDGDSDQLGIPDEKCCLMTFGNIGRHSHCHFIIKQRLNAKTEQELSCVPIVRSDTGMTSDMSDLDKRFFWKGEVFPLFS